MNARGIIYNNPINPITNLYMPKMLEVIFTLFNIFLPT